MSTNDIPAIPPFLMQRADTDYIHARAVDRPDIISGPARHTDKAQKPEETVAAGEFEPGRIDPAAATAPTAPLAEAATDPAADHPPVSAPIESPCPAVKVAAAPIIVIDGLACAAHGGCSPGDLDLFRALTGYRLDTRSSTWRAVNDEGQRVSIADRLFATLAEEAFRFADRQRRSGTLSSPRSGTRSGTRWRTPSDTPADDGGSPGDLTTDDLTLALVPIRRAAASIGARGLSAFERLERAILRLRDAASDGRGRGLNIPIVAEGVETDEHGAFLEQAQCRNLQGHLVDGPARSGNMPT